MKHLYAWEKKTNVHVLARQIMPDCSSSQGLSEYVLISKLSFFRKTDFSGRCPLKLNSQPYDNLKVVSN